ncbi:hypothetical protein [Accumulibacter sp.]|uniref:hypothetical protein n=1 Tax=Accumulibacter sp. TaxID=2053492 RepID=UPI00258275B0|nr:hypothetical protein [Accumulibacter sp.]
MSGMRSASSSTSAYTAEVEALLFDKVEQPTGGGYQDLDAAADLGDLRFDVLPKTQAL